MASTKVFALQDGEMVEIGEMEIPDSPWFHEVQRLEWELIKRYDRGEFDE